MALLAVWPAVYSRVSKSGTKRKAQALDCSRNLSGR